MNARSMRPFFLAGSAFLGLMVSAAAADPPDNKKPSPPAAVCRPWESPTGALTNLQRSHANDSSTFVVQDELDFLISPDGGGACASAVAIDLLQTLRVMAGLEKMGNPHKAVLAAFARQPELLKGRVTNEQLVTLIRSYQEHLGHAQLGVDIESAPNSGYRLHTRTWPEDAGPSFDAVPRRAKVLSYTVTDPDGKTIGRHFVLLKEHSGGQVVVVDPAKPLGDHRYVIDFKPGDRGPRGRVFLTNPPGMPRSKKNVYELNTIFSVSLPGAPPADALPPQAPASVEDINQKVDRTAAALRGTKDFLDPREWRRKTAEFGLPGLDLPAEYGGAGWPAAKMVEVFKKAGEHNLNFRDVVGGGHVRPLLKSKAPEVLDIVRQVASGKGYIAIAITEPDAGSDVPAIKSSAKKVEGGYRISGTKRFNARLEQATHVIVFTQGAAGKPGKLSVFVLPIDTPGLTIEKLQAHGLTGNSYGGLSFKDLFVPDKYLIGEDGQGLEIFREHFLYWRLMQAAAALGTGENALKQMACRIKSREAFGGPIGRFTHLQQPIGQHTTELKMANALAKEAADLLDRRDLDAAEPLINGLKAEGVEIALKAVDAAARAFGGEGYSTSVDLGDRLRDLNGLRIADGTTDVMRMLVVRRVFGSEFWEMAIEPKRPAAER